MSAEGIRADGRSVDLGVWRLGSRRVACEVETSIYSLSSILRASYKFTDNAYVFLSWQDSAAGLLNVVLTPKAVDENLEVLMGNFVNELLDQRLREVTEKQFGELRTLITAQAFSEGNLLDPDRDEQDYHLDPRGIGRIR